MGFDIYAMEQMLLARLALLASLVPIVGLFDRVDLTDDSPYPAGAQVFFVKLIPDDQVSRSARHSALWSFDLYVDSGRIDSAQKLAAATLFKDAMATLIGWEFTPGREVQIASSQESAVETRITRISFGFTLPVYLAG